MTDYDVAKRLESVRNALDKAYIEARSSACRQCIQEADVALSGLKRELGHPRAGLAGDESPPGQPLGEIRCRR